MDKTIVNSDNAPKPIGPYSQAVMAGNTLYCSGQVAINPQTGELNNADIYTETHQVMKNLKAVLFEAGLDFNHVAKCSIFLKDMNDFGEVNKIYGAYFTGLFPARETVQVSRLPLDVNVEISLIAAK
jgi:2-iminobutanoate/2-iminopropanoate deaminase